MDNDTRAVWVGVAVMVWFVIVGLMAMAALGCGSAELERMPGQDRAETIVWRGVYAETGRAPSVEWIHVFDCGDGRGFTLDGGDGRCVSGAIWERSAEAQVAWYPEAPRISGTAYAHELLHEHLFLRDGNGDGAHAGPDWKANGALAVAGQALVEEGL